MTRFFPHLFLSGKRTSLLLSGVYSVLCDAPFLIFFCHALGEIVPNELLSTLKLKLINYILMEFLIILFKFVNVISCMYFDGDISA